jgi:hypothetical protein
MIGINMKKLSTFFAAAALTLIAGAASATTQTCERLGNSNNYRCPTDGTSYTVSNVSNEAEARAAADAHAAAIAAQNQDQSQGQGQSQSSTNDNSNTNTNGGNTVSFSDPAHTTSFNVGVGVAIRLGDGVQARSAREAAALLKEWGQDCIALDVLLHSPQVRKLGYDVDCSAKK